MKVFVVLVWAVALFPSVLFALEAAETQKMAVCLVCKVTKGEAEEEPVKATRTYERQEYGFCSEKCAKAFSADPVAYLPPVFPRSAPSFSLKDLEGKSLTPLALQGKVVLIDFWATWCAPCRKSMPELQALHDRYSDQGFTVVGVSIDEGGADKVRKYVKSKKLTYPIAIDDSARPAWDAFRVKAVPAAYLLDRQGKIVAQWTGASAGRDELEKGIERLLAAD